MKYLFNTLLLLALSGLYVIAQANEELKFYGALKTSIDLSDDGDDSNVSVSNNSTRVGIKGSKVLEDDLTVLYQIELGVDTTERDKIDSGRNSYVGFKNQYGKLLVGQHDTPLKDIRDHGAELFNDTIAGSRSMISAVANDDGAKIDNRVKNAIMYYSPKFSNVQVFLLYSTDNEKPPESPDNNDNDLIGGSIIYKEGPMYVGFAIEQSSNPGAEDTDAVRLAASYKFDVYQVGGIYETVDNGDNDSLTRDAAALNLRYNVSDKTYTGIQYAMAEEYDGSSDTGGSNISLGIVTKLAKTTSVYAVASMTQNDDNASFGLSQGGIQDTVVAATPGDDVSGVSVGIVHKF